jgi:hypothetical protein
MLSSFVTACVSGRTSHSRLLCLMHVAGDLYRHSHPSALRSSSLAYGRQPLPRILGFRSSHILPRGLEVIGVQCAVQGVLRLRDLNYRVIWAGFMVQLA